MTKFDLHWMDNDEWFDFADDEEAAPYLTEKAPPEAVASYNRYLEQLKRLAALEG